jgi:hypothetical protein
VTFVAAGVAALSAPVLARAYPWPIKPFDQQHVVRGAFDDPRLGGTFHFGVDISAPDGTPVYAVAPGTIFRYSDAVAVHQPGGHEFSYWHVQATVPEHAYVHEGEQIGVVRPGFGHVHFAEWDGRTYLNPLRPGGLTPFDDTTTPVVGPIAVGETDGMVQAAVDAYDPPPIEPPPPWNESVWSPALVRWRLVGDGIDSDWSVAEDANVYHLPDEFDQIYAPGTRQNFAGRPGRYVFWLTHGMALPDGHYVLDVEASDTRGNTGSASLAFDVPLAQSLNTVKLASR